MATTTASRPATVNLGDLLADRYARATELLADRRNYSKSIPGTLFVWTDTKSAPHGYWVATVTNCTCPDSTVGHGARLLGGTCKHQVLAWLVARQDAPRSIDVARQARQAAALAEIQALAS